MVGAGPRNARSSSDVVGVYNTLVVVSRDVSVEASPINLLEGVGEVDRDVMLDVFITSN